MYLGIDLGTSGVKTLLMDAEQRVLGSATAILTVDRPHLGWAEQNPSDWIHATETALAELRKNHNLDQVRGIGLSGQMHGAVALDAADGVIRPAILWNDGRSQAQADRLDADPQFRQLSGNIVFPGFTAPKLVWMAENEPQNFARIAKVLLPKDYLRLWLTGEHVAEMSDAAGTSWLDTGGRCWSPALLSKSGMRIEQMPRLVEGTEISGLLRHELAERLGLPAGIPVAGGGGDNAATAVGAGTIAVGDGFISLGTSGVLFAATDRYLPRPESAVHAFCHCLPGMWHQMGVVLSASAALSWLSSLTGRKPEEMTQALGVTLRAPGEEIFLPYLSGERTPHNDANLRASLTGLSASSDITAVTQAVLEGVAFALADNLDALRAAGSDPREFLVLGGGARSRYWLSVIATALNVPLLVSESENLGAAYGAARLGMIATTGAKPQDICKSPQISTEIFPVAGLIDAYCDKREMFQTAFKAQHDRA